MTELMEKILSRENMMQAYKKVKVKNGASGVDGIGTEEIREYLIENWEEIREKIKKRKYKPQPVLRVEIPKPNGGTRNLGIPSVVDRIIEQAIVQVITPIIEPYFSEYSYGFRPKRSAQQAVLKLLEYFNDGYLYVVDIDLEKFFDNVNQDKLMILIEQRISDRRILKLIRQWMRSGILYGNILTISELGTSQGSVISPLLANIYLNTLDRLWEKYGRTHGILVRYADDTVIICKNKKSANHAQSLLQYIMGKLDLKLHPVKTKIINMWDGTEGFDFLGLHHMRFSKINKKGNRYGETYQYPSKKAMKKMKRTVKESINQRYLLIKTEEELIKVLNPKITGWRNYYKTGA